MIVKYFIPDDGDEQNHPNVFHINLPASQPTLRDIKTAFPVRGTYHFRFLKVVAGHTVWMDFVDDHASVPLHQGEIFMKVSRTSEPISPRVPSAAARAVNSASDSPAAVSSKNAVPPPSKPVKPIKQNSDKQLLNFSEDPTEEHNTAAPTAPAAASASNTDNDLLGFDSAPAVPAANSSNQDLFGLESLKPTQGPPPMMGSSVPPMQSSSPMMNNAMGGNVRGSISGGPMGGGRPLGAGPMSGGPMNGAAMNAMGGSRGNSNSNLYGMGQGMPYGAANQQQGQYKQNDPFNNLAGLQPGGASPSMQNNRGRSY